MSAFRCQLCAAGLRDLRAVSAHYLDRHPGQAPRLADQRPEARQAEAPALEPGTGCVLVTCPDCSGRIGYRPGALCPCGWRPIPRADP